MNLGGKRSGSTRESWREGLVDKYDQHTFYKYMQLAKNKKIKENAFFISL